MGVDLQRHARFRSGIKDCFHIQIRAFAVWDQTSCGVTNDIHMWIADGADHSLRNFLARLTQAQLRHVLFPLGDRRKKDVQRLAREVGFGDVADRKVPLPDCVATVHRAMDAGLNVIDTAPGASSAFWRSSFASVPNPDRSRRVASMIPR